MSISRVQVRRCSILVAGLCFTALASAAEIGQIKTSKGRVEVTRAGQTLPGSVGTRLQTSDTLTTGADGSVGITMNDDSMLSAGPNTVLSLDRYEFDSTTNQGRFNATLNKGTLAVISGRLAKQTPGAMTVQTPAAVLGVRGTEFLVSAQ